MLNKILISLLVVIFSFILITNLKVNALTQPYHPPEPNLLGENHYYSVFFRGNGEAVVNFRSQFTNNRDYSLSTITYFVSKAVTISNISVYQRTNAYKYPCNPPYGRPEPLELDSETESKTPSVSALPAPSPASVNQMYTETTIAPCLDQPMYYSGGINYLKADFQHNGNVLRVILPRAVSVSESVDLIIYYRSDDYANEKFPGSFNYAFDTLKSNDLIDSIQVGISTEQDFVLKGARGQVKYRQDLPEFMPPSTTGAMELYNKEFDAYYNRIGQGTLYNYASHLASMESYMVSGSYADSIWKLYIKHIVFGLLLVFLGGLVIFIVIKKAFELISPNTDKKVTLKSSFWSRLDNNQRSLLIASFGSMLGATLSVIYTLVLFIFVSRVENYFSYGNELETIFLLLIVVLSFGLYAAFLILPAILISVKRSITWGVMTFILTICWLLLYLIIVLFLGAFLFNNNERTIEYPLSVGSGSGSSNSYLE